MPEMEESYLLLLILFEYNALLRRTLSEVLKATNFEVVEANSADGALETLESVSQIDIVITDVEMPGSMDGIGLAKLIRQRWPTIPLLVMSGRIRPREGQLPPGVAFLPKPTIPRSEEHTSELQSLMRISYAVFCLKKKNH